jgi:lambda repressor-like predicted transcriptional regulator
MQRCLPGAHHCAWSDHGQSVDEIVEKYAAGIAASALAHSYTASSDTIKRIVQAHGLHWRSRKEAAQAAESSRRSRAALCHPGEHRCLWAEHGSILDALIHDYVDQRKSLNEVARSYPPSRTTVVRILAAHGISLRSRSQQCTRPLNMDELWRRRTTQQASLQDLAAECGLSRQALQKRLERFAQAAAKDSPDPPACRSGAHHCKWALQGGPVDAILDDFREPGVTLTELTRRYAYTRATVHTVLMAHDVQYEVHKGIGQQVSA